jgi:hypothetical protein
MQWLVLINKEAARRLLEIAQAQQGFFTTKQAMRAGFAEKVHAYHVNAGNWIREPPWNLPARRFPDTGAPGPHALVSVVAKPTGNSPRRLQP